MGHTFTVLVVCGCSFKIPSAVEIFGENPSTFLDVVISANVRTMSLGGRGSLSCAGIHSILTDNANVQSTYNKCTCVELLLQVLEHVLHH